MDGVLIDLKNSKLDLKETTRILHLSDAHVGMTDSSSPNQEKRIAKFVDSLARDVENQSIDIVAVTGDIACKAAEAEYALFRQWIFQPLSAMPAFGNARWYVVPGNHDVDFTADYANQESIVKYSDGRMGLPGSEGLAARSNVINRFKPFIAFAGSIAPFPGPAGPHWMTADGYHVDLVPAPAGRVLRVISLNTAWCEDRPGKDAQKHAWPGAGLLRQALTHEPSAALTLVLGHHPLYFVENGERQSIRDLLAENRAIYLHGHSHLPDITDENRKDSNRFLALMAHAIDSPSRGSKESKVRIVGYNLIEWNTGDEFLKFFPRVWSTGGFTLADTLGNWPRDGDCYRILLPSSAAGSNSGSWELGWKGLCAPLQPPPSSADRQRFANFGRPTLPVAAELDVDCAPVVEATQKLMAVNRRPATVVRLQAPLGEGSSTVFLQVCHAMAVEGWTVRIQDEHDPTPAKLPGELRDIGSPPVLLALRTPRDSQDLLKIISVVEQAQAKSNRQLAFLLEGNHLHWNRLRAKLIDEHWRFFDQIAVIEWGLPERKERWFPQATFPVTDQPGELGKDVTFPDNPCWSLLGAKAVLDEREGRFSGALIERLRTSIDGNLTPGIRTLLGVAGAVHGEGKAILTIETLASIFCPDKSPEIALDRLETNPEFLHLLRFELRLLEREGHKVVLTRHPAVGRAIAQATGHGSSVAVEAVLNSRRRGHDVPFRDEWIDLASTPYHIAGFLDSHDPGSAGLEEMTALANAWERCALPRANSTFPESQRDKLWRDLYLNLAERHLEQNDPVLACLAALAGLRKGPGDPLHQPLRQFADVFESAGTMSRNGVLAGKASKVHSMLTAVEKGVPPKAAKTRPSQGAVHSNGSSAIADARKALADLASSLPASRNSPAWAKDLRTGGTARFL
jgi:metallophosphoesterase superfamily enzyme